MPLSLEFIEVKPSKTKLVTDRRKIRSHAARAGNMTGPASMPEELDQMKKSKSSINWPVAVELTDTDGRLEENHTPSSKSDCSALTTQTANRAARPVMNNYVLIPFAGNDTIIPISHSKLYPLPFLSLVLDNYLTHLAVAIPEVDGPTETGLLKRSWFPMVLHSQVLFQIIVLFSASHYALHQNGQTYTRDILSIKHCALRDLQIGLCTNGGFEKDENIAAVGKLASYEAIFGHEEAYHVHMNALKRMLNHRGGLSSLGMNGFLARLLIFIDTNSAFLLNTKLHLTESNFPRREPWVPPNPCRFVGSS